MHRAFSFVASAALVSLVAACSGSSNTDLNDPRGKGATTSSGTSSSGTSSPGSSTDTSPTETEPGTSSGSPSSAQGPVAIKNVSYASSSSTSSFWRAVDVTFAVEKKTQTRIDRVQEVSVTFDGQKRTYATEGCSGNWFEVGGVVTLHVEDNGTSSQASLPCMGVSEREETTQPWGDKVTVEMKGLLDDATPWKASASGTR